MKLIYYTTFILKSQYGHFSFSLKNFIPRLYFFQTIWYNLYRTDIESEKAMAKLYFKYGAMGSSKTAQALITKFNYEERGMRVWLVKPAIETRDGKSIRSRIGLEAEAQLIAKEDSVSDIFEKISTPPDVIIADECQFFTAKQIDEFRKIVDERDVPVLCFGLRTDFLTKLFEGSARLFELADSISEIKTICECGKKASVNARVDADGKIITSGAQVFLGGNESYIAMCHKCWHDKIKKQEAK